MVGSHLHATSCPGGLRAPLPRKFDYHPLAILAPYNHSNISRDTFHPLNTTREASRLEDENYPFSWLPPEDADAHAKELAERGPEAFPD